MARTRLIGKKGAKGLQWGVDSTHTLALEETIETDGFPFVGVVANGVAVASVFVQCSYDGTNWADLATLTSGANRATSGTWPFRYLRVSAKGGGGTVTGLSILARGGE